MENNKISIFGASENVSREHYALAVGLGRFLAHKELIIQTGGYGGIMEAVSQGAYQTYKDGHFNPLDYVYGITMDCSPKQSNIYCKELKVGLPDQSVEDQYFNRLSHLLTARAFAIVGDNSLGVNKEFMEFLYFNQRLWSQRKKLVILHIDPLSARQQFEIDKYQQLFTWLNDYILFSNVPEQAVTWLLS